MSDTTNGEVYEGGDVDAENGELSHVASKLEELIIVDSSTERNKKGRTESSTQTEEFEYMFHTCCHCELIQYKNKLNILSNIGLFTILKCWENCNSSTLQTLAKCGPILGTSNAKSLGLKL